MRYSSIIVSRDGSNSVITLNRPDKLNALNAAMLNELGGAISQIAKDKKCRGAIITGATARSFCSGADIGYINSLKSEGDAHAFVENVHAIFDSIEDLEKPAIAAIDGYCFGAGCELAMACDIRIATKTSVFGQPEVKLGIIPGGGGTYRLPKLVGSAKAKELIFTGDYVNADEALRIGLVNKVTASASLMKEAKAMLSRIGQNSANAVKNAKHAINAGCKNGSSVEEEAFVRAFSHPDRKEGLDAFLRHRKPDFKE